MLTTREQDAAQIFSSPWKHSTLPNPRVRGTNPSPNNDPFMYDWLLRPTMCRHKPPSDFHQTEPSFLTPSVNSASSSADRVHFLPVEPRATRCRRPKTHHKERATAVAASPSRSSPRADWGGGGVSSITDRFPSSGTHSRAKTVVLCAHSSGLPSDAAVVAPISRISRVLLPEARTTRGSSGCSVTDASRPSRLVMSTLLVGRSRSRPNSQIRTRAIKASRL